MERYIGLDVHRDSCTVAVTGPSGKRLKSFVVETNGSALVEAIRCVPGRRHICLEEGTQSAWLHEVLSPHARGGRSRCSREATGIDERQSRCLDPGRRAADRGHRSINTPELMRRARARTLPRRLSHASRRQY